MSLKIRPTYPNHTEEERLEEYALNQVKGVTGMYKKYIRYSPSGRKALQRALRVAQSYGTASDYMRASYNHFLSVGGLVGKKKTII